MSDRFLFWGPALIWATTWHVILYQFGNVSALNSVAYRFILASAILFVIARWRGDSLAVSLRLHPWMALTGALQYGVGYVGTYEAERHLASGLVAVLFSLMIFTNAIGGALFMGQAITRRFVISGCIGITGVALIFWPDIAAAGGKDDVWLGVGLGLMAVTSASLGNILTLRVSRDGLALTTLLGWSMGYGGVVLLAVASITGDGLHFDTRISYWLSLLYLSVFGSVIAFLLYFKLAKRQGPARAALTGMVIPVIALAVSATFEGWKITPTAAVGIALCLTGLWGATRRTVAN